MLLNRLRRVVETIGHIYVIYLTVLRPLALISWIHELDDFLKSL